MKRPIALLAVFSMAIPMISQGSLLFSDNFDRPDSLDIDSSTAGMGGSVGSMTYWESDGIGADDALTHVTNNVLNTADGPNASVIGLTSHNFTDAAITSDGGFSISMDVMTLAGLKDRDRYSGFGVGLSSADISSLDYDFNQTVGVGPRGQWDGTPGGSADFYVSWSPYNNGDFDSIQLFTWDTTGGTEITTLPDGIADNQFGTLKANFTFSDFNAGSTVDVEVFFNGASITTSSFTWSGTDENYIALSSRQNTAMVLDNLFIETIPEPSTLSLVAVAFFGLLMARRAKA